MGASKYEFNPQRLDIDIQNNKERYNSKYQYIESQLTEILYHDAIRQEETWSIVIDILRCIKLKETLK